MNRSAVALFRSGAAVKLQAPKLHTYVWRPSFVQGKPRAELDQPAKSAGFTKLRYGLNEPERHEYAHEPHVGVDHLYEPHVGSIDKPVVVSAMTVHGSDMIVGCLGGCHPSVPESGPYYQYVPPNALCLCVDCGLHFVAKTNEELTFYPDGSQPSDKVSFAEVEDFLSKHIRYGSPLLC
eukprot:NODE_2582_length_768_cov_352.532684_g1807_i0.p1 GENE.NODE_2582_length_768_cov_352.532684_g1807_i0~~NODE_2582_length_768_cov_352.532684_g1807_i0.p1  ORF type:complete len:179 (+),score=37.59 NODE_2582_length_768_cov_352.532684_g1807_i0:69-605(+)